MIWDYHVWENWQLFDPGSDEVLKLRSLMDIWRMCWFCLETERSFPLYFCRSSSPEMFMFYFVNADEPLCIGVFFHSGSIENHQIFVHNLQEVLYEEIKMYITYSLTYLWLVFTVNLLTSIHQLFIECRILALWPFIQQPNDREMATQNHPFIEDSPDFPQTTWKCPWRHVRLPGGYLSEESWWSDKPSPAVPSWNNRVYIALLALPSTNWQGLYLNRND